MKRTLRDRRHQGTRRAVLARLRRGDRTVQQLARDLGMTGNGVRLHLTRLAREGLVEDRGAVPGVSKPSRRYGLAPEGIRLFSRAHGLMLSGLLEEVNRRLGPNGVRRLLERVGHQMGRTRVAPGGRPAGGIPAVVRLMRDLGGDPVVTRDGGTICVRLHDCPLGDLVGRHPEVCAFARALVSEAAGVDADGRCSHGVRPGCRFDVTPARAAER